MTHPLVGVRIDIETRSTLPIKVGAYRYSEDPHFKVLIVSYSPLREVDGTVKMGKPRVLDMLDHAARTKFEQIITDPGFQKHAFNANFERVCLSKWAGLPNGTYIDPENWHCSAIRANVNGIFGTLDEVAKAVRSPIRKDVRGKALIKFFCSPIPARSAHTCGCVTFHEPVAHPVEFREFQDYCDQDVMTEAGVASQVPDIPDFVQAEYEADQRINDRGVRHFAGLSRAALEQVNAAKDQTMLELRALTGIANPNSGKQFGEWLDAQGYPMTSLDKDHRAEALLDPFIPAVVAEALTLKGQASLSSVTKHKAMLATRCSDGRIRGSLQFYGAHTGREAGRGFQPQNLPRYEAPTADRHALIRGTLAPHDVPLAAKGTVRAALVPARDHVFIVPDYNAIEARCLGWQSGEKWVEAEFRGDGKIYEATAATMFGVRKDDIVRGRSKEHGCDECGKCEWCNHRSKGKVSNLALGYAGGAGALVTMGAEEAGIDIGNYAELNAQWKVAGSPGKFHEWNRDMHDYPELLRLRDLYRNASPATVRFWKLCAKAWDMASAGKGARFGAGQRFSMIRDGRHNRLILPSGRSIWYRFARTHINPDHPTTREGEPRIDRRTFMGKSKGVGQVRTDTHGGKLTENITQAVARDVLFDLIMKVEALTAQGWPGRIVLHVHDEVVIEVHKKHADQVLADTLGLMSVAPDWAPGLLVKGAGGIMERYGK